LKFEGGISDQHPAVGFSPVARGITNPALGRYKNLFDGPEYIFINKTDVLCQRSMYLQAHKLECLAKLPFCM
jgi:hypothetical protein